MKLFVDQTIEQFRERLTLVSALENTVINMTTLYRNAWG